MLAVTESKRLPRRPYFFAKGADKHRIQEGKVCHFWQAFGGNCAKNGKTSAIFDTPRIHKLYLANLR